jgi:hypothetical protein
MSPLAMRWRRYDSAIVLAVQEILKDCEHAGCLSLSALMTTIIISMVQVVQNCERIYKPKNHQNGSYMFATEQSPIYLKANARAAHVARCFDYFQSGLTCSADTTIGPGVYQEHWFLSSGFQRECGSFDT